MDDKSKQRGILTFCLSNGYPVVETQNFEVCMMTKVFREASKVVKLQQRRIDYYQIGDDQIRGMNKCGDRKVFDWRC